MKINIWLVLIVICNTRVTAEIALPQPPQPPTTVGSIPPCAEPAVLTFISNLLYLPVLKEFVDDRNTAILQTVQDIGKKQVALREAQVHIEQIESSLSKLTDPTNGAIAGTKKEITGLQESLVAQQHLKKGSLCNAQAATYLLGPMSIGLERGGITKEQFDSMLCYLDQLQQCLSGKSSHPSCQGLASNVYTSLIAHQKAAAKDEHGNYLEPIYREYPESYFRQQVQNLSHAISSSQDDLDELKENIELIRGRIQVRLETLKSYESRALDLNNEIAQLKNQIEAYHKDINAAVVTLQENKQAISAARDTLLTLKNRLTVIDSSMYTKCPQYLQALLS